MTELADGRRIHARVVALYARVNEQGFWFRSPAPVALELPESLRISGKIAVVDRDRIVCALMTKAANTKESILALAAAGHGDDAYALARVITENAVIIAWLLQDNWPRKLDAYGMFAFAFQARLRDLFTKYWAEKPEPAPLDGDTRAVAKEVFGGGWTKWARLPKADDPTKKTSGTFDEMCKDLTPPKNGGDRSNMLYELAYFHTSGYVHSSPPSIQQIASRLGYKFRIQAEPSANLATLAVHLSNIAMWFALKALDEWIGAGLGEELAAIEAEMRGQSNTT
jgi:uncharacterized protein DUF5677